MTNQIPVKLLTEEERTTCPVCGLKSITSCRCFMSHQTCEKGHKWHIEWKNLKETKSDGRMHVSFHYNVKVIDQ